MQIHDNGKTPRYGRWRERWWTPTRAKAQDTRASPNGLETHLFRKWGDVGHLHVWALSQWSNGCTSYSRSLLGLPLFVFSSISPNTTYFTILQMCPNRFNFLSLILCMMIMFLLLSILFLISSCVIICNAVTREVVESKILAYLGRLRNLKY